MDRDDLTLRPLTETAVPAGGTGWIRITESAESARLFRRAVRLLRKQSDCARPVFRVVGLSWHTQFLRWRRGLKRYPCGRCGKAIRWRNAQGCWYCGDVLCYDCWDKYGHCGHSEADDFERRCKKGKTVNERLPYSAVPRSS